MARSQTFYCLSSIKFAGLLVLGPLRIHRLKIFLTAKKSKLGPPPSELEHCLQIGSPLMVGKTMEIIELDVRSGTGYVNYSDPFLKSFLGNDLDSWQRRQIGRAHHAGVRSSHTAASPLCSGFYSHFPLAICVTVGSNSSVRNMVKEMRVEGTCCAEGLLLFSLRTSSAIPA